MILKPNIYFSSITISTSQSTISSTIEEKSDFCVSELFKYNIPDIPGGSEIKIIFNYYHYLDVRINTFWELTIDPKYLESFTYN